MEKSSKCDFTPKKRPLLPHLHLSPPLPAPPNPRLSARKASRQAPWISAARVSWTAAKAHSRDLRRGARGRVDCRDGSTDGGVFFVGDGKRFFVARRPADRPTEVGGAAQFFEGFTNQRGKAEVRGGFFGAPATRVEVVFTNQPTEHKQTNCGKQASKQAGKQASRQASKQAGRQASKQAGRQASKQASKQAGKQASKQAMTCHLGLGMCLNTFATVNTTFLVMPAHHPPKKRRTTKAFRGERGHPAPRSSCWAPPRGRALRRPHEASGGARVRLGRLGEPGVAEGQGEGRPSSPKRSQGHRKETHQETERKHQDGQTSGNIKKHQETSRNIKKHQETSRNINQANPKDTHQERSGSRKQEFVSQKESRLRLKVMFKCKGSIGSLGMGNPTLFSIWVVLSITLGHSK